MLNKANSIQYTLFQTIYMYYVLHIYFNSIVNSSKTENIYNIYLRPHDIVITKPLNTLLYAVLIFLSFNAECLLHRESPIILLQHVLNSCTFISILSLCLTNVTIEGQRER